MITGAYNGGAYYTVGGPARFAETLLPLVRAAGGELRLEVDVSHILMEHGRATGIVYSCVLPSGGVQAQHAPGRLSVIRVKSLQTQSVSVCLSP